VRFEYVGSIARRKGERQGAPRRSQSSSLSLSDRGHGVYHVYGVVRGHRGARGPSCPADSYDPALSCDCVSPRTMRRPPCPPCDRWTPMRAVERRRAPLSVPAETRDVDPPLASRIRSFVVYLLQTGGCFTVMARAMENRAQIEAKTSLVARYTVGMENTVYGTERFGCMLQQSPAAPIPREFRASSGQRPYLEPSRESSPRMHVSPREEHDAD